MNVPPSSSDKTSLWQQKFTSILTDFEDYAQRLFTFEDEEDVHQARVSLRTITMLTGFLKSSPHKKVDPGQLFALHNRSKLILKTLGQVRDFDVMTTHIATINNGKFDLQHLTHTIELERQVARLELELHMPKYLDESFFELWQSFIQAQLPQHVPHLKTKRHFKKLHKKFENKYLTYIAHRDIDGPTHVDTFDALHEVRLVTKSLRYAYTYLEFALDKHTPESIAAKIKLYKQIQEQLGLMNDYTNLREKLRQIQNDYPYLINDELLAFENKVNKKLTKSLRAIHLPEINSLKKNKK